MVGITYSVEVHHPGLNKYRMLTGKDPYVVQQKASSQRAQWDEMWCRKQEQDERRRERESLQQDKQEKKLTANQRTADAESEIEAARCILAATLNVNDAIDWDSLNDTSPFPETVPTEPTKPTLPPPPDPRNPAYIAKLGLLGWIFPQVKRHLMEQAGNRYKSAVSDWEKETQKAEHWYEQLFQAYRAQYVEWKKREQAYIAEQQQKNAAIDDDKRRYREGNADAILDYCDLVLSRSAYPSWCPQDYRLDFLIETFTLIVDYRLPSCENLPRIKQVRYIQSRDEFDEILLKTNELNELYDNVVYQIALRTIHELYEADVIGALEAIVFNGYVHTIDPATGKHVKPCIMSIQALRPEFAGINLAYVDPKACFKKLKGIGSSQLHALSPIPPIMQIDRTDERFVSPQTVIAQINEGINLAAVPWEDFEHLVRELFEKEFSQYGGEVKITRASRDGGVDAVAFDPDPIRGGKIIIQAKRYNNTVGVSAVRDLYGTLMNEGATKGLLVTTSDYGPDAYAFAKDKPITLLNGSNLLHLLEKHGHRARIDLREVKTTAGESQL